MFRVRGILDLDIYHLALGVRIAEEVWRASLSLVVGAGPDDALGLRVEPVEGLDAAAAAGFPALRALRVSGSAEAVGKTGRP